MSSLVSCNYVILGGHILHISKTMFMKLIFYLQLSDRLPYVPLQEFVTKTYWTLKKEESVNMTIHPLFTLSELHNIREIYSKYFQNIIYKTDISSAAQWSTTLCCFAGILYTFNVCNRTLHLRQFQSFNIKNSFQFILKHACVGKFTFIKF